MDNYEFKNRTNKGEIPKGRILIEGNVFDIPQRLKDIDKDFFVALNIKTQDFELHHEGQPHSTYCLTFPFGQLDSRAIDLVRERTAARGQDIMQEINKHNEAIERSNEKRADDGYDQILKEHYKFNHLRGRGITVNKQEGVLV